MSLEILGERSPIPSPYGARGRSIKKTRYRVIGYREPFAACLNDNELDSEEWKTAAIGNRCSPFEFKTGDIVKIFVES